MSKHFGELIISEVEQMRASGMTYKEIANRLHLNNGEVVRNLLNRKKAKDKQLAYGILPRPKGRPRKSALDDAQQKDNQIKRLMMENELLRSFLQLVGRR